MMKYRAAFPLKHRFLRFKHPAVAQLHELHASSDVFGWQHWRFLGTAAARDIPNVDRRRRISKEERKEMVVAYVNKYRLMNAGKFPGAKDTRNQVGGGYYNIRSILQELKYNANLPTMETTYNSTMVGETGKVDGVSESIEVPQSLVEPTSVDETMSDTTMKDYENVRIVCDNNISAEDVSGSPRMNDLEPQRATMETTYSSTMVGETGEVAGVSESLEVLDSLVEPTSVDETINYTTTKDSENIHIVCDSNISAEDVSGSHRMNDLEPQTAAMQTTYSSTMVGKTGTVAGVSESLEVLESLVEPTSVDETIIDMAMKDSENRQIVCDSRTSAEDVSGSHRMNDLETQRECVKVSDADTDKVMRNRQVETPSLVEQISVDETVKATTMKDSENLERVCDRKFSAEDVAGSPGMIDVELRIESVKASAAGDNLIDIDSRQVSETRSFVEQTSVDETMKATAMKYSENPAKPGHASEVHETPRTTEVGETNMALSQASESERSTPEIKGQKTQDNDPSKSSLWSNLKSFASNVINSWWKA